MSTIAAPGPERVAVSMPTRDAILDAAERLFAGRGFDGVSVREIAADAGLKNQASLYHHFAHKQAIYESVVRRGVASIVAIVSRDTDGAAGARYLDDVFDYLVEHPHLARLIQRAGLDDSAFVRGAVPDLVRPLYDEGVRSLAAASGWPRDELPHLAAALYHLIFGYFADAALLRALLPDDPSGARAIGRQRRFVKAAVDRLLGSDHAHAEDADREDAVTELAWRSGSMPTSS